MGVQIGRVLKYTVRAGANQLVLSVTAGQQRDGKHSCPSGGQQIPNRITNCVALGRFNSETFLALQEKIGFRFRLLRITAIDNYDVLTNTQGSGRWLHLLGFPGRGDPMQDSLPAQSLQQLDRARKRLWFQQELMKQFDVPFFYLFQLLS